MIRRFASLACAALAVSRAVPAGEPLARKLPATTAVYMEIDVARLRETGLDYLRFLDAERARDIEFQVTTLLGCLKDLAAHREFRPALFEGVGDVKLYLALMAKDEPEVKTHTWKSPKWDFEKGERIEGEFEVHTYTVRKDFATSFVVETTAEAAESFMQELKGLLGRLAEEGAGGDAPAWKEIEVESGEMIAGPSGATTLGRLGGYLVVSDTNPVELWAALLAPAEPSLAESDLYRRYTGAGERPAAVVLVNLEVLLEKLEETFTRNLEEAMEQSGLAEGGEVAPGDVPWRVRQARSNLDGFILVEKLLSLDKLKAAGLRAGLSVGEESASTAAAATLHLERPVSETLRMILDGGHALEAPAAGKREGLAVMARVGLRDILAQVAENLGQYADPFAGVMALMKMQVGYDLNDVLEGVAGDAYLFVDFVKKERERSRWDRGKRTFVAERAVTFQPEFMVLAGLSDSEAFSEMVSSMYAKLAGQPGGLAAVKKRTFLGSDVYLVGQGIDQEDAEPDGVNAFAAAVVGRHLAFGSWKDVTGLIRRARAGAEGGVPHVARAIADHPDANLLVVVPGSFARKAQAMMKEGGGDPFEELKGLLQELPLPEEDQELAETLKGSITKLVEALMAVAEKEQARSSGAIARGRLSGEFYEIRFESRVGK